MAVIICAFSKLSDHRLPMTSLNLSDKMCSRMSLILSLCALAPSMRILPNRAPRKSSTPLSYKKEVMCSAPVVSGQPCNDCRCLQYILHMPCKALPCLMCCRCACCSSQPWSSVTSTHAACCSTMLSTNEVKWYVTAMCSEHAVSPWLQTGC